MDEIYIIKDTRYIDEFKDKTFSGFKKSDVLKTLIKSIKKIKINGIFMMGW